MKTRNIVGAILIIAGLILSVCTKDGSNHEILMRFGGIVMLAAGAYIAKLFDFQEGGAR